MGRKLGPPSPVGEGELGLHLTQCGQGGPRPICILSFILIYPAIWPQQIWAENWGLWPLLGRGAGSSSNIMWPGPRPTCMPGFILMQPTVWPQDRQTTVNTYGCRAISVAGPTVWNSLPDFIRDQTISADCFRRLLKTYLFARY